MLICTSIDMVLFLMCHSFLVIVTYTHINTSFRIITDGSGLCAVFDGPPPFYDALYSRANNFTTDDILHKVLHVK